MTVEEVDEEYADPVVVLDDEPAVDEEDVGFGTQIGPESIEFPLASVRKIMKEAVPDGRFSLDLVSGINRAMGVFLLYVSSAAQEITSEQGRSTIGPAEINVALIETGFAEIAEDVRRALKLEGLGLKKRKRLNH